MQNPTIEFHDRIPVAKAGLGVSQMTYASGRLGVSVNEFGGISSLCYLGEQPEGSAKELFRGEPTTSWVRVLRPQLSIEGRAYHLELHDTQHLPFGYASRFAIEGEGVELLHHLTLLPDAVVMWIEVIRNDSRKPLRLRLEHHERTAATGTTSVPRTFTPWEVIGSGITRLAEDTVPDDEWERRVSVTGKIDETGQAVVSAGIRHSSTRLTLASTDGLTLDVKMTGRMSMITDTFEVGSHAIALVIGKSHEAVSAKDTAVARVASAAKAEHSFLRAIASYPEAETGNDALDSFFSNTPAILDALMVPDVSGGMRANSLGYWIWGWDTMMSATTWLAAGKSEFVRDALRFYRDTADADFGIGHSFTREPRVYLTQAPNAQMLYATMLMHYISFTRDKNAIDEFYPFVKTIYSRLVASMAASGLSTGFGMYPDHPVAAGQTGRHTDVSVFNNAIGYQGLRSVEALAELAGDNDTATETRARSRAIENSFLATFWDDEQGYLLDSVDALTGTPRKHYPAYAVLWETDYARDLLAEKISTCGEFIANQLTDRRGFLMYPRWDPVFEMSEEFSQVMAIYDVFCLRCLADNGDQARLKLWREGIAYYWNHLTLIEGDAVQTVNDSGTLDMPGQKQAFGARSQYLAFLASQVGISFDWGGITLRSGASLPLVVRRLRYVGRSIDISTTGGGGFPASLSVNGRIVTGTCKVPSSELNDVPEGATVSIDYVRTAERPASPILLSLDGGEVVAVESVGQSLRTTIKASGHVYVRFYSPTRPKLEFDGEVSRVAFEEAAGIGSALLAACLSEKVLTITS